MSWYLFLILPALAQDAPPPGSLWSEDRALTLIGVDGNERRLGDLVTVIISEATASQLSANTATDRNSSVSSGVTALFGLEKKLGSTNGLAIGAEAGASFDGNGTTSSAGQLEGNLTCEVVEVLPNGNLIIHGTKEVRANREVQVLELNGMIRPRDIRMDNTVESQFIANSRIHFTGDGVVSDKQGPGVAHRVLDVATPF